MDNDTLFDIFKTAILDEHKAYEFYRKAAADTGNMEAKRIFENFATTELAHRTQLEELYKTLKK